MSVASNDDAQVAALAKKLLHGGLPQLSDRERRVITSIARRQHISRSLNQTSQEATFGDKLADQVAQFGGSWPFIIIFVTGLVVWIVLNSIVLARAGSTFDGYPYIFLNLILSMIAALQAPMILMSQNRQAERDRLSAGLDYEVNLKAELEIMDLRDKVDALRIDRIEEILHAHAGQLDRIEAQVTP